MDDSFDVVLALSYQPLGPYAQDGFSFSVSCCISSRASTFTRRYNFGDSLFHEIFQVE